MPCWLPTAQFQYESSREVICDFQSFSCVGVLQGGTTYILGVLKDLQGVSTATIQYIWGPCIDDLLLILIVLGLIGNYLVLVKSYL